MAKGNAKQTWVHPLANSRPTMGQGTKTNGRGLKTVARQDKPRNPHESHASERSNNRNRPCLDAKKRQKFLHSNCHIESLNVYMEH
jgi:hypothetical protein